MQSLTDRSEFMQRFMMARHEDQELWGKSCPVFAFSGITMSRIKPTMFGVEMSAWIMIHEPSVALHRVGFRVGLHNLRRTEAAELVLMRSDTAASVCRFGRR